MKFLTNIDLNKNEIQNVSLQKLSADPSSANLVAGMVWMNTSSTPYVVKYYNGTEIITLGSLDYETSASNIKMDGTASVGSLSTVARADHVHPSDTSRVPTTRTVNGHALSANVTVADSDITFQGTNTSVQEAIDLTLNGMTLRQIIARLRSPAFTTTTSTINTSANIPTSNAVKSYVDTAVGAVDAMRFKGTIGTGGTVTSLPTSGVKVGDTYRVITAGTYASQTCEVGDLIIATATTPTWTVAQTNIDGAITEISSGTGISVTGSGASRTVALDTSAVATSSANGLMSSSNYNRLANMVRSYKNPALTSSSGLCTWNILTDIEIGAVTINETSTGSVVFADVAWSGEGDVSIKIISDSDIASGTYNAVVIGV